MALILPTTSIEIARPHGNFEIPIHQAIPRGDFNDDPQERVVYGQAIGEIGPSQEVIISQLADLLGRRVVGYDSRLPAQVRDPIMDTVEVAYSTHARVLDTLTSERYRVIGHSLFGITAGAILEQDKGQISDMMLISPAAVTSDVIVSKEWRDKMRELSLEQRIRMFKHYETHWKKHTLELLFGFGVVNVAAETARGVTNPIRSMRAGSDLFTDIAPGMRYALNAFAVLANVSIVPELQRAWGNGTYVQIVTGKFDPVFGATTMQEAMHSHMGVHKRGVGHPNLSTASGEVQIRAAAAIINSGEPSRTTSRLRQNTIRNEERNE